MGKRTNNHSGYHPHRANRTDVNSRRRSCPRIDGYAINGGSNGVIVNIGRADWATSRTGSKPIPAIDRITPSIEKIRKYSWDSIQY